MCSSCSLSPGGSVKNMWDNWSLKLAPEVKYCFCLCCCSLCITTCFSTSQSIFFWRLACRYIRVGCIFIILHVCLTCAHNIHILTVETGSCCKYCVFPAGRCEVQSHKKSPSQTLTCFMSTIQRCQDVTVSSWRPLSKQTLLQWATAHQDNSKYPGGLTVCLCEVKHRFDPWVSCREKILTGGKE